MDDYSELIAMFREISAESPFLGAALVVVGALICIMTLVCLVISILLAISYAKYNRRENSAGLTGEQTARAILDQNGLMNIDVVTVGSVLFGNSYSHYFRKVRLRRRTTGKTSLTALGMGAQKAALAVLDKEGDPDMEKRIRLAVACTFGPLAFIPLIIVGAVLDVMLFHSNGAVFTTVSCAGLVFYLFSVILNVLMLKTEKKAQQRAYELLRRNRMATEEELAQLGDLFRLYNIQYINNIILSALELIYRVLQVAIKLKGGNKAGSKA